MYHPQNKLLFLTLPPPPLNMPISNFPRPQGAPWILKWSRLLGAHVSSIVSEKFCIFELYRSISPLLPRFKSFYCIILKQTSNILCQKILPLSLMACQKILAPPHSLPKQIVSHSLSGIEWICRKNWIFNQDITIKCWCYWGCRPIISIHIHGYVSEYCQGEGYKSNLKVGLQ